MQATLLENMPSLFDTEVVATNTETPGLPSCDCGYSCSLEHWMEVYRRVQEEFLLGEIAGGEGADWT